MTALLVMLRGINLGGQKRIAMAALREALAERGMPQALTYAQSGNIVLPVPPDGDAASCVRGLVRERFGLDVGVVTRTAEELRAVVAGDPFGEVATDPKLYQVSFLDREVPAEAEHRLREACSAGELVHVAGREIYVWHPHGIARSKLWATAAKLGAGRATGPGEPYVATARNWRTVTALLQMMHPEVRSPTGSTG